MSVENDKVCCNCRHCIREWSENYCRCVCEIDGQYKSYIQVMTYWCRHWSKDRRVEDDS